MKQPRCFAEIPVSVSGKSSRISAMGGLLAAESARVPSVAEVRFGLATTSEDAHGPAIRIPMTCRVFAVAGVDAEVLNPVVGLVAVDVVDDLGPDKPPAEMQFHNHPVFVDRAVGPDAFREWIVDGPYRAVSVPHREPFPEGVRGPSGVVALLPRVPRCAVRGPRHVKARLGAGYAPPRWRAPRVVDRLSARTNHTCLPWAGYHVRHLDTI